MPLGDSSTRLAIADPGARTAYLVVDCESVPDGNLLAAVKYAGRGYSPEEAIARAQEEAREQNWNGSSFVPVTFHVPISVCMLRVAADYSLINFKCLDAPQFRPREIVNQFWFGATHYNAKLVTFNGRGFDLPLLELAAFRYGISAREHYLARDRYRGPIDLMDWFTNFGACRLSGGLNLLAKLLGKPGKMDITGEQVYGLYREGKLQEINDYCLCDTLDTYFVFLRTRLMTGEITAEQEAELIDHAQVILRDKSTDFPVLHRYLSHWTEAEAA